MIEFMPLILIRDVFTEKSTAGKLFIDGKQYCFTMEDVARAEGIKIQGKTCISEGIYKVTVTMSTRFNRELPLLENVLGFNGIRIHGGNTSEDTEGCICVAFSRANTDTIQGSAEKGITEFVKSQRIPTYIIIKNKEGF